MSVYHPDGTLIANMSDIATTPCTQDFPQPTVQFSAANPSWAIRDAPRFVPNPSGVVPANVSCPPYARGTANTSGFDVTNNALDVYVFLPGAAADDAPGTTPHGDSSVAGGGYGYTGLRSEFLQLTGPIPPLPDEAFGTWFSWYHAYNQSGAEADIERCSTRAVHQTPSGGFS